MKEKILTWFKKEELIFVGIYKKLTYLQMWLWRILSLNASNNTEGKQKPEFVDISSLDIYYLFQFFITILSEKAWRYIGLHANPQTGEIEKDFKRAHAAIDCIIFLVDKLEPHLSKDECNRLRTLITNLQMNYANQVETKSK